MASNGTTAAITISSSTSITSLPVSSSSPPSTIAPSTVIETTTSFSTLTPSTSSSSDVPSTSAVVFTTASTTIPPSTVPVSTTAPQIVTSVITESETNGGTPTVNTIVITSTASVAGPTAVSSATTATTTNLSSTTSSGPAALTTSGNSNTKASPGLSPGGKIAVAVVVPVAAVALIVLALLFLWRRRKQRKDAEELRRKEVEEYGFNPNNDPTLPTVGGTSSQGEDMPDMRESDGAGYRGWGTTPAARKASTTLSGGPIGIAISDNGSHQGGYQPSSPTAVTGTNSDVHSGDPLMGSPTKSSPYNGRPTSADSETIGALGGAPTAMGNRQDPNIHRGPSNASSAYSGANRSQNSGEAPLSPAESSPQYYNDGMYDEVMPQHGPYGDGSYGGGGQPIIRDVQARRNTRIENPSVLPQPGNAGIALNF